MQREAAENAASLQEAQAHAQAHIRQLEDALQQEKEKAGTMESDQI